MTRRAVVRIAGSGVLAAAVAGCAAGPADDAAAEDTAAAAAVEETSAEMAEAHNRLTEEEVAAGWRLLFDGESTAGWRGYRRDAVPDGWEVVDGELRRTGPGGDIITVDRFRDFELALEWNVEPGGNSGIFYRAIEGEGPIYMYAPEMQILDDDGHADGQSPLTSAGANYGLYPAPRGVVRPAGEWNAARIRVQDNRVTYWLNGQQIVEYELRGPDWEERVANSKFAEWPDFGRAEEGHIGLQDHGDLVRFRNIRIREL